MERIHHPAMERETDERQGGDVRNKGGRLYNEWDGRIRRMKEARWEKGDVRTVRADVFCIGRGFE